MITTMWDKIEALRGEVVVIETLSSIQCLPGVVQYIMLLGELNGVLPDHIVIKGPSRLYEINNIQSNKTASHIIPYSISYHNDEYLPITFSHILSVVQAGDHTKSNYENFLSASKAAKAGIVLSKSVPKGPTH
jgi:hypothetical protein